MDLLPHSTSSEGKKQEGITFLLFPMKQDGVEVKPIITLGGSHGEHRALHRCEGAGGNRIGEEGKGWTYAKGLLAHERRASPASADPRGPGKPGAKRQGEAGNGSLLDDLSFKSKLARLEIDLKALNTQSPLPCLAAAGASRGPSPPS